MRVYLVRHGETILNQRGCYYGVTDAALSLQGRRQAKELGAFFQTIPLCGVMASPLCRAVETAEIMMEGRDEPLTIRMDERLCEQNFGIFESGTYEELTKKYPEEWKAWNRDFSGYRIPGGESFSDVRTRTEDFLRELWQLSEARGREDALLLVAHKGTLGHLLAASLGLGLDGYWNFVFEQGCYSRVDLEDGYAIIRCLNQRIRIH